MNSQAMYSGLHYMYTGPCMNCAISLHGMYSGCMPTHANPCQTMKGPSHHSTAASGVACGEDRGEVGGVVDGGCEPLRAVER